VKWRRDWLRYWTVIERFSWWESVPEDAVTEMA
jgi:hypothetical protein